MAKHHTGAASGAATAMAVEPIAESLASLPDLAYEQIATLAYQYWQERGCPIGSPEQDWLRAEADLQKQVMGT
ncbi:MAG TPA: DUF2934 domain-containing protein [Terriglobales bacterium]|jgi:hypothetical protein